jgi:small nuclear ribonucleoprotein (snRNP)-like protein
VVGVLRGYDAFMNLVLDETVEQGQEKHNLGMVVGFARQILLPAPVDHLREMEKNSYVLFFAGAI